MLHAGGRTDHKRFTYSIEWVLGSLAEWSGTHAPGALRLFPFASNTATGYFCLDYRQSAANPPIVFVDFNYDFDEPSAVLPVAPDLVTLLADLHD